MDLFSLLGLLTSTRASKKKHNSLCMRARVQILLGNSKSSGIARSISRTFFFPNTEHGRIRSPICTDTNLEFLPKGGGIDRIKTQPLMITQGADPRPFSQSQVHSEILLRSLRCFQDEDTRDEHCCYCGRSGVFKHLNHPEKNPIEIPLAESLICCMRHLTLNKVSHKM